MSAAAARGNPYLQVRLPQETIERLKEIAGEGEGGRAGGVSLFVRELIYLALEEPMPAQWGEKAGKEAVVLSGIVEDVNDLMKEARNAADMDPERAAHLLEVMDRNVSQTRDRALRLKCEAIAGRICIELFRAGALTIKEG